MDFVWALSLLWWKMVTVLWQCCCRKERAKVGASARTTEGNGSEESFDPCGHLASSLRGHFCKEGSVSMIPLFEIGELWEKTWEYCRGNEGNGACNLVCLLADAAGAFFGVQFEGNVSKHTKKVEKCKGEREWRMYLVDSSRYTSVV